MLTIKTLNFNKINTTKMLLIAWTIVLLLFRPSVIGQDHNSLVFCVFASITLSLFTFSRNFAFAITSRKRTIVILTLITMAYFLLQGLFVGNAPKTVINSSICIIGCIFCITYVINKYGTGVIFKTIVMVHFLLSISSIVTLLLLAINGFDIEAVPVLLKLHTYSKSDLAEAIFGEHSLLIPFSLIWGKLSLYGIDLPRFLGIYREPGMAQIYFWTSFFLTYFVRIKHIKIIRSCIFIGAFFTFSTTGIFSFIIGYAALLFFNKTGRFKWIKNTIALMFVSLAGAIIILLPGIGIIDKLGTESGQDRLSSYEYSYHKFLENPVIGKGYYYGFSKDAEGRFKGEEQFIGILGVAYQLGALGLFLYFMCWIYSLVKLADRKNHCIYLPCLLTLLLFQPSYNDILVWFLLLIDTKDLAPNIHIKQPYPSVHKYSLLGNAGFQSIQIIINP